MMQIIDDRAVQIVTKAVWLVLGHGKASLLGNSLKSRMSGLHFLEASARCQVETVAKINHGTNDCGCLDLGAAAFDGLFCELQTAERIGFPKVNAFTQPVVIILGGIECAIS